MQRVLRILSIVIRLRDSSLRYKIVYYRIVNAEYDLANGDEFDNAIYRFFNDKKPTQIGWEYYAFANLNVDLSRYLNTFLPKRIPLTVGASISALSMSDVEIDEVKRQTFPDQRKEVTLFYRGTMTPEHENWIWLPVELRISMNYKDYIQLAGTVSPF